MHPRRASQQQPAGRKGIWNLQKARAALLRTPKPPSLGPPGSSDPFINIHSIFQAGKPETFAAQTTGNLFFFFFEISKLPFQLHSTLSFLWAPVALQGSSGKGARGAEETDAASCLTTPN